MDTIEANPANNLVFADYVRPVWQRKWFVLFVALLATAITYAEAKRQPKVYNAGTLVYYQDPGDPVTGNANPTTDRSLQDLAGLLSADNVAATVARQINYPGSPGGLLNHVTISARAGQDFVAISGSANDPRLAAAIANGYAQQMVVATNRSAQQRIAAAIAVTQQQLARTSKAQAAAGTRQALTAQLGRLQLASSVPSASTRQVSPATPPAAPTSPRPTRSAIFAFVLAISLAVAVVFGIERFDRRLKTPSDLERSYGLPLLTALPHSSDPAPSADGLIGLGPGFHEAFGLLRTNIQLLTLDAAPRSIAIVSGIPGEGKSTVVRNLAIALCESGKRVVVVEADLRRPMQSGLFGIPAGPGLAEVLTGAVALSEVVHEVPTLAPGIDTLNSIHSAAQPPASSNGGRPSAAPEAVVSVLLAGTHPANPATVLESDRVREVLDELGTSYDIVLLDSAPLLSVTDSVPLVRYADATLIVGRMGLTTRDSVRRMTDFLARVTDARVLGIVANDLTKMDAAGYGYGYEYGYGYGYSHDVVITPSSAKSARRRNTPTEPV